MLRSSGLCLKTVMSGNRNQRENTEMWKAILILRIKMFLLLIKVTTVAASIEPTIHQALWEVVCIH